jgi:hypothetical protein
MSKVSQIVRRVVALVFAAVWFQTVVHTAACHCDEAIDDHGGCNESMVCSCACHHAIAPTHEAPVCAEHREIAWVPASNETVSLPLVPDDIFRPPLALS